MATTPIPEDFGQIDATSPVPTGPSPGVQVIKTLRGIRRAIAEKHEALGGEPGEPKVASDVEGLISIRGGFFREFKHGTIFFHSAVGKAFYVGRASQRYNQLGGPNGFLGWPVSDALPDRLDPGAGVTKFQNGAIYWWPDVDPIEMRPVVLRYVGFHCFGETDEFSGSDEPYFTFGVVPMRTDQGPPDPPQTRIYTDVDGGESRTDNIELYHGLPFGLVLLITFSEHDEGNPEEYKEQVQAVVDRVLDRVAEALTTVPVIGLPLGFIGAFGLALASPSITDAVNKLLGTDDEHFPPAQLTITGKDMMRLTRADLQIFDGGIQAHLESPLLSGDGGSYKVYFTIETAEPERPE
jgi:hypothetical protein